MLPLMEAFYTIQGEGYHKGSAAYFIRIGGCDVGCHWCDVKESWDAEKHPPTATERIVSEAVKYSKTIVVTGGEPLTWDMTLLTQMLKAEGAQTHIETSGAYTLTGKWDWICLSPKKLKLPTKEVYEKAAQTAEKRKARLIKDYGEVDGMRIFNKEITEKKYKNEELPLIKAKELKAEIYKKYDKDDVLQVSPGFDQWLSVIVYKDFFDEEIKRFYENIELYLKLVKKYGKKIAVKLYKLSIYPPKIEELFLDMKK